jgi:prepilin-type N-terminal cleavage/methylation domain-containing protein
MIGIPYTGILTIRDTDYVICLKRGIMKTEKSGFTLIELLVVIAIIALLMGILMPALNRVREAAKRAVCSSQVKQIGTAMTAYTSDNDNRMPVYNSNNTNTNPYLLIHSYALYRSDGPYVYLSGKPIPMKLAVLYEGGYVADPKVFYCPSNINPLYKFESYNSPKPWGTLPQNFNATDGEGHNQWVRMGYTYLPIDPRQPINSTTRMPEETAKTIDKLDPFIPYLTDLIRHKSEISHKRQNTYAVNALFKDGHIELCTNERVFDNQVWDQMENGVVPELTGNYIVFQLIGGRTADFCL